MHMLGLRQSACNAARRKYHLVSDLGNDEPNGQRLWHLQTMLR